jgi:hypothetical protein
MEAAMGLSQRQKEIGAVALAAVGTGVLVVFQPVVVLGEAAYTLFHPIGWIASNIIGVATWVTRLKNESFERHFRNGTNPRLDPKLKRVAATIDFYTFSKEDFTEEFEFLAGDWCLTEQEAGELLASLTKTTLTPQDRDWEFVKRRIAELKFYSDNRLADSRLQAKAQSVQTPA